MAENPDNRSCPQRDSAEHDEQAGASRSFRRICKKRGSAKPKLLEEMMEMDDLNRAYKRVKANKGASGVDGMTVEEVYPYLRENKHRLH